MDVDGTYAIILFISGDLIYKSYIRLAGYSASLSPDWPLLIRNSGVSSPWNFFCAREANCTREQ